MSGDSVDIKGQIMNMTTTTMNMLIMVTTRPCWRKEFRLRALHVPHFTLYILCMDELLDLTLYNVFINYFLWYLRRWFLWFSRVLKHSFMVNIFVISKRISWPENANYLLLIVFNFLKTFMCDVIMMVIRTVTAVGFYTFSMHWHCINHNSDGTPRCKRKRS